MLVSLSGEKYSSIKIFIDDQAHASHIFIKIYFWNDIEDLFLKHVTDKTIGIYKENVTLVRLFFCVKKSIIRITICSLNLKTNTILFFNGYQSVILTETLISKGKLKKVKFIKIKHQTIWTKKTECKTAVISWLETGIARRECVIPFFYSMKFSTCLTVIQISVIWNFKNGRGIWFTHIKWRNEDTIYRIH